MGSLSDFKCEVFFPDQKAATHEAVSRWSNSHVELPEIVVKPSSESDITDAVNYAKTNNLSVVPACGGHGSFVPITPKTLYLDMRHFNSVTLDKNSKTVRIGGGALVGEVSKTLTDQGYYTLWPNSDAVGYVGCLLGGGNDTMVGLHGLMIDVVQSIEFMPASGQKIILSLGSTGDELAVFDAIRGAGVGLGVILSVTVQAFQLSDLHLTDMDKIWVRRLVFPPSAIEAATNCFATLAQPSPPLLYTLGYMRSPPNTPAPGTPMIMLTGTYHGPSEDGKQVCAPLFDPNIVDKAIKAESVLIPLATANSAFNALNAHGGWKDIYSCQLEAIDAESLQTIFANWLKLATEFEDAKPSLCIFSRFNTHQLMQNAPAANSKRGFPRDRSASGFILASCSSKSTSEALFDFAGEFLRTARRKETGPPRTLANNQWPGIDLEDIMTEENLSSWTKTKATWDPENLFWSPYAPCAKMGEIFGR